jgi:hypothetical protein
MLATIEFTVVPYATPVSCLTYSSTLKMEATCSSETSVDFQRTTRPYIPDNRTHHNHRCENLRSYKIHKYVIVTVVLYGCKTSSLTLSEDIDLGCEQVAEDNIRISRKELTDKAVVVN